MMSGIALVTGTSSGFGKLIAQTLAHEGFHVVAGMRDAAGRNAGARDDLLHHARDTGGRIEVVELDILDDTSVDRAVEVALRASQRIDVLVNNAGVITPGPVELQPIDMLAQNLDSNFYGSLRVFRAVMPSMRAARRGLVIQLSSGLGRALVPGFGGYCASKAALEAAMEIASYEVAQFGVEIAIIEPGQYPTCLQKTGLESLAASEQRMSSEEPERLAAYTANIQGLRHGLEGGDANPQEVADAVLKLVRSPRGERMLRTTVGPYSQAVDQINAAAAGVQAALIKGAGLSEMVKLRT